MYSLKSVRGWKAHHLPQEENLCISLVNNFHVCIMVAIIQSIWREVHGGRIKTLVQIKLLSFDASISIFHHMGTNIVIVEIGSPFLYLHRKTFKHHSQNVQEKICWPKYKSRKCLKFKYYGILPTEIAVLLFLSWDCESRCRSLQAQFSSI